MLYPSPLPIELNPLDTLKFESAFIVSYLIKRKRKYGVSCNKELLMDYCTDSTKYMIE